MCWLKFKGERDCAEAKIICLRLMLLLDHVSIFYGRVDRWEYHKQFLGHPAPYLNSREIILLVSSNRYPSPEQDSNLGLQQPLYLKLSDDLN